MEKRKALYGLTIASYLSGEITYKRVSRYNRPVPKIGDVIKSGGLEVKVASRIIPLSQDREHCIIPKLWAIPNPE